MTPARPRLAADVFPAVFPFFLALDRGLSVVSAGPSLLRVLPEAVGARLADLLASARPEVPLSFEGLATSGGQLFVLETLAPRMLLRGQFLHLGEEGLVVFLGSPWADRPSAFAELGLGLGDFALHDATTDLLHVSQLQRTALADARRLAALLEKRGAELRAANESLTVRNELLESAEAMTRGILETSPEAFVAIGPDGTVRTFNPAAEELFGWAASEVLGRNVSMLMPAPDRLAHDGYLARYGRTGERRVIGHRREVAAVRRDGSTFPCELSVGEVSTAAGVTFTGFLRDLSAARRAEAALRESEADYRSVVEGVKEVVFRTDAEGRWTFLNRSWTEVTGFGVEEALGRSFLEYVHPEDRERSATLFDALLSREEDHCRQEARYVTRGGDVRWIEVYARKTQAVDGRPAGTTGTLYDMTERRRVEAELRRANEAAVEAARLKSKFLANMSHEIRTPLNAVIGMTGLLLETSLSGEQQEFVDTIRTSGKALLELVNEVLDFSKIESGRLEILRNPFDLRECAEDAVDLVAPLAAAKGLELVLDVDAPVGSAWEGDEARIRQVVVNLLTNAVKFTPRGEVVLSVSARRDPGERPVLRFAVRDTGPGIPPSSRGRLFRAFSQLDSAATRRHGGTGLGLAICRSLAEAMGGAVGHSDAPGGGSVFALELPVDEAAPRSGMLTKGPVRLCGVRALVVEDNDAAREALVRLCGRLGLEVASDASGESALGRVSAGEEFGVVLADATLPGVPAEALFRAFRSRFGAHSPAAVLLAPLGRRPSRPEGAGAAVATVSKPVKLGPLGEALATALRLSGTWSVPAPKREEVALRAADGRPLRVLVVDDSAVNRRVATRVLEKAGLRPDLASNGLEALSAAKRQRYDVVLMDVQMPEMDGLDATRAIRAELPASGQPRIVALTAGAFREEQERCLEAGMDDYLSKPVRPEELLAALERGGAVSAARGAGEAPGWEEAVAAALRDLGRLGGGDDGGAFVAGTVELFLEEARTGLERIEAAVAAGDAARVALLAHGLKGTARNLGAARAGDAIQALERAAREGLGDEAPALLRGAAGELGTLREFLESGRWRDRPEPAAPGGREAGRGGPGGPRT